MLEGSAGAAVAAAAQSRHLSLVIAVLMLLTVAVGVAVRVGAQVQSGDAVPVPGPHGPPHLPGVVPSGQGCLLHSLLLEGSAGVAAVEALSQLPSEVVAVVMLLTAAVGVGVQAQSGNAALVPGPL